MLRDSFFSPQRNTALLVLITLGLAGAVALYVFGYLPAHREEVNARYFRTLQRIEHNAGEKEQAYGKVMEGIQNLFQEGTANWQKDTIKKLLIRTNLPLIYRGIITKHKLRNLEFHIQKGDTMPAFVFSTYYKAPVEKSVLPHPFRVISKPDTNEYITATVRFDAFFQDLRHPDIFDHLLVLNSDTDGKQADHNILYATFATPPRLKTHLVDKNNQAIASLLLRDSLGLMVSRIVNMRLEGRPYTVFIKTIRLGRQTYWLGGAVPTDRYDAEVRALRTEWVEDVIAVVLVLLLALPLLKIVLLGREESLSQADAWSCLLGTAVIVAVLTLWLSKQAADRLDERHQRAQLKGLAEQTRDRLTAELLRMHEQLVRADREVCAAGPVFHGYRYDAHLDPYARRLDLSNLAARLRHLPIYPFARRIHWLDSSGRACVRWERGDSALPFMPRLNDRDYFKNVVNNRLWRIQQLVDTTSSSELQQLLDQSTNKTLGFALEANVSRTTGDKNLVLACPSCDIIQEGSGLTKPPPAETKKKSPRLLQVKLKVLCLAVRSVRTFTQAVLPPGFQVCLVDADGEVILHSDANLSQEENLFAECDSSAELRALLRARDHDWRPVRYHQRPHLLYAQPLGTLPFTIVALADQSAAEQYTAHTLALAALLLTGMALLLLFFNAGVTLLFASPSKLLSTRWPFGRLWPDPDQSGLYLVTALCTIWVLLVESVWHWPHWLMRWLPATVPQIGPIEQLVRLLVGGGILLLFTYWLLIHIRFTRPTPSRPSQQSIPVSFWLMALGLLLLLLVGLALIDQWGRLLVYFIGLVAPMVALVIGWQALQQTEHDAISSKRDSFKEWLKRWHWARRNAFALLVTTWVLAAGVVPAYCVYKLAYVVEAHGRQRLAQLTLANRWATLEPAFNHDRKLGLRPAALFLRSDSCEWYDTTGLTWQHDTTHMAKQMPQESTRFMQLLHNLTLSFAPSSGCAALLTTYDSPPGGLYWPPLNLSAPNNTLHFVPYYATVGDSILVVSSSAPSYHLLSAYLTDSPNAPWHQYALRYAMLILEGALFVAFIFFLIRLLLKRLFHYRQFDQFTPKETMPAWLHPPIPVDVCVWVVAAGGNRFDLLPNLHKRLQTAATPDLLHEVALGDWAALAQVPPGKLRVVTDVRTDLASAASLRKLFSAWERNPAPLVLVSAQPPTEPVPASCQVVQWPLHENQPLPNIHPDAQLTEAGFQALIRRECWPTLALSKLEPTLQGWLENNFTDAQQAGRLDVLRDDLILYLQTLAEPHYRTLWNDLTQPEHAILYDVAQDGLVNSRYPQPIEGLLRKGLLVFDHRLEVFNESFRNYILSVVTPAQAAHWYAEASRDGAWMQARTPLALTLTAIGLFLLITQRETFSTVGIYLTGLTSFVPLALRFFEIFGTGKAKAASQ